MRSKFLLQLAEAVRALEPPSVGRRRVEVLERGDGWIMYRVVSDTRLRVGYASWRGGHYKVFAMLTDSCAFYNGDGLVTGHRLTVRDIADLMAVRTHEELIRLVWRHVNEALQHGEKEPCEGVWVLP